jgi:hypothetical protein
MEQFQGFLVIVDISGYTGFVRMHRTAVAHAEQIITELMESVLDVHGPPLVLDKLQGDAAVFYTTEASIGVAGAIAAQVARFFHAFNSLEAELVSCNLCVCGACRQIGRLQLKAILHHGDLVLKEMGGRVELAGPDVILSHQLLKNTVDGDEYILMTRKFHELSGDMQGLEAHHGAEETDMGVVETIVFYPDPSAVPEYNATLSRRLRRLARVEARGTIRLLRGRGEREFRNLPSR